MEAEIIGIDHIYLSVSSLERSEAFYDVVLLRVLGFRKNRFILGADAHVQYFNRLFGLVLRPARHGTGAHDPYAPGLHHLCLRVEGAVDVDRVANALVAAGITVSTPRRFPEYAADYYAAFITDPDGVRLEVTNFELSEESAWSIGIETPANRGVKAGRPTLSLTFGRPVAAER